MLLGTANYIAKFVPNMSTITETIRHLLKDEGRMSKNLRLNVSKTF